MARTIKRTTDFNLFPINQTVYDLMKEDADRVKRITAWKESLTTRFPSAKSEIDKIIRTLYISTYDGCLGYVNAYNLENNVLKEAKPATIEQVNELLKEQTADSETVKLLKQIAKDDQETYKAIFESWEAGVAGLIFSTDSIKNFYLDYLPNTYIKEHLNKEPVITLGELDQAKLKEIISDIFANLYSGFTSTKKQEDLNGFQKGINDGLEKIKELINDKRATKKPTEPDKPAEDIEVIKKELANAKAELDNWLKVFSKDEYSEGAKEVKTYIGSLEQFARDLTAILRRFSKDPEMIYLPPTPPNSPETKPSGGNDDIPPIN